MEAIVNEGKIQLQNQQSPAYESTNFLILLGKSICFTGQLNCTIGGISIDRSKAQQFAIERGMILKSGVSKKLDYLVTADPNSLSGKSLKARDIGVKILAESVFWTWMGVAVD